MFNALAGRRHFKMGPELLEAIVLACVDDETQFERFCEQVRFGRSGLRSFAKTA